MVDTTAPAIIRVEGLRAGYGERVILDDVTFSVARGEVFVILGGSGSGKSTLLKHLIGLHDPLAGRIWIGPEEITGADDATLARTRRRYGVMYQAGALFGSMTVLENVMLPLEEFTDLPPAAREAVARAKLRLVELTGAEHRLPAELSGGMVKRAAIARAMALEPEILFLDEPSAGLDPITSANLDDLVTSLARSLRVTFVIVTHELPSIFAIADRVIMVDSTARGVVAIGDPRELRDRSEDPRVRAFFAPRRGKEAAA